MSKRQLGPSPPTSCLGWCIPNSFSDSGRREGFGLIMKACRAISGPGRRQRARERKSMAVTMDSPDGSRKSTGRFWVEGRWNRWKKDGLGKGLSGSRLGTEYSGLGSLLPPIIAPCKHWTWPWAGLDCHEVRP